MRLLHGLMAGLLAVSLGGCAQGGYTPTKQLAGGVLGGAAGGLVGSQFGSGRGQIAATAAGTIIGALLGSEFGRSLDQADQMYLSRAQYQALEYAPVGARTNWSNPGSGNSGWVTPVQTYQTASGYCREYEHVVYIGGRAQTIYGTACRQPDGTWRSVS